MSTLSNNISTVIANPLPYVRAKLDQAISGRAMEVDPKTGRPNRMHSLAAKDPLLMIRPKQVALQTDLDPNGKDWKEIEALVKIVALYSAARASLPIGDALEVRNNQVINGLLTEVLDSAQQLANSHLIQTMDSGVSINLPDTVEPSSTHPLDSIEIRYWRDMDTNEINSASIIFTPTADARDRQPLNITLPDNSKYLTALKKAYPPA
jgi:hypothetical protein